MRNKAITLLTGVVLVLSSAALSFGQEPTTTPIPQTPIQTPTTVTTPVPQTPTTVTKAVQNPDSTFTVIEYPVGKEVQVILDPVGITADGAATILREDAGTKIKINLNKLPADIATISLYAVDENGVVTSLGIATIASGSANFNTTTLLGKFMLIASPEAKLTAYDPNTKVLFRSAVPTGLAVVPRVTSAVGEKVSATAATEPVPATTKTEPVPATPVVETVPATPVVETVPATPVVETVPATPVVETVPATTKVEPVPATPVVEAVPATTKVEPVPATAYTVPMLNIPTFKKGDDTKVKVNFSGPLTGARANLFITPRKDGPTEVKIRFHDLKDAPSGKIYHVWAVAPDNTFVKVGQIVNAPGRNEAEIKSEVTLADFGLLITTEDAGDHTSPHGESVGVFEIVK